MGGKLRSIVLLGLTTLGALPLLASQVLSAPVLSLQGKDGFTNFESPTVKPITTARIVDRDFVLVCNTPDDSVEIWDVHGPRFVARVPVGLRPVSVLWVPSLSRFYTANHLGDSVSVVRLSWSTTAQRLMVQHERTEWVGDEPRMLALAPDQGSLLVTLGSQSAVSWRKLGDLSALVPGFSERIHLVDDYSHPQAALNHPSAILSHGKALYALGFRGGDSFVHDFDLWSFDFGTLRVGKLGGLGSIKPMMAFASNGDLYVLSWQSQNRRLGEPAVAAAPTGFVESHLIRVRGLVSGKPVFEDRDLHRDSQGKVVPRSRALAMPTDLVLWEGSKGVDKVFFTAFGSSRLGILEPKGSSPAAWPIRAVDLPLQKGSRQGMAGPRGLALKSANAKDRLLPGARIYILDRVDSSLVVVDPKTEKVLSVTPLHQDPTPAYIREGRRFHYDARLSGNGFVSCASCHVDARTDGKGWNLDGPKTAIPVSIPKTLFDGVTGSQARTLKSWPVSKGFMVTQSLQGLVNSETEEICQELFRNTPYHWRGDRAGFEDFNGAVVSLLGGKNVAPAGKPAAGLHPGEMVAYRKFIESVHPMPNPEQGFDRVYSGQPSHKGKRDGSGAQLGLELFHELRITDPKTLRDDPSLAGRSCVQCHALPEGSNNRLTRMGLSTKQIIETPTLRNVAGREARLEFSPFSQSPIVTNDFGLEHQGSLRSVQHFMALTFGHDFTPKTVGQLFALTQFVREFDRGVAPAIGLTFTVDPANAAKIGPLLALLERQADQANAGLVVRFWSPSGWRGFVWEPGRSGRGRYVEVGGNSVLTRASLLGLPRQRGEHLVVQAVPLGEELRIASPSGRVSLQRGPAPSAIRLETARPDTAWRRVPDFVDNWKAGTGPKDFRWTGVYEGSTIAVKEPPSLKSLRLLQYGLMQDGPGLGLKQLRHEAPRRLRVSGKDIRRGARLVLFTADDSRQAPPYRTARSVRTLVLSLHPTSERSAGGLPIFETSAELDARELYTLMLGGRKAPGVAKALAASLGEPPAKGSFQPKLWNLHWVWIVNADGSLATGGWQPLRID